MTYSMVATLLSSYFAISMNQRVRYHKNISKKSSCINEITVRVIFNEGCKLQVEGHCFTTAETTQIFTNATIKPKHYALDYVQA